MKVFTFNAPSWVSARDLGGTGGRGGRGGGRGGGWGGGGGWGDNHCAKARSSNRNTPVTVPFFFSLRFVFDVK